jgi:hypothetical protein
MVGYVMLTEPPVKVMLNLCEICGKPKGGKNRVCYACWKAGKTITSPFCLRCGKPTENRQRRNCEECRKTRKGRENAAQYRRDKLRGVNQKAEPDDPTVALRDDIYAQTANVLTDAEIAAKREKFLALLAADVHCGSYGQPRGWHLADRAESGGFEVIANKHMQGGEAGAGTDRMHTTRAFENRESRRLHD